MARRTSRSASNLAPFAVDSLRPAQLVPYYLMACFLYYECDSPAITDADFDALARRLAAEWARVRHRHKFLLRKDSLRSGYQLAGKLPTLVRGAALAWAAERKAGALLIKRRTGKI